MQSVELLHSILSISEKWHNDDALNVTKNWLNSCDKLRPLDFNANVKIKDALRAATRVGYLPMGFSDLKSENEELYRYISNRIGNDKFRGGPFD
jgi:hypothetical protein